MATKVTWPERFLQYFTAEQIARLDYLTGIPMSNGTFHCKVCPSPQTGSRQKHFEQHVRELKAFQKDKEETLRKQRQKQLSNLHKNGTKVKEEKSPFYTNPCVSCGAQIPRTGKRGKPPAKCAECKAK